MNVNPISVHISYGSKLYTDEKRKLGSEKSGKWFQVARILLNVNRGELESESVKFVKSIGTDFFHCFMKHVSHETTRKC